MPFSELKSHSRGTIGDRPRLSAAFRSVYEEAYALGLKGCTTFRPNPVTGAVLSAEETGENSPHCCSIELEAD